MARSNRRAPQRAADRAIPDPRGGRTTFTYDANGNVRTLLASNLDITTQSWTSQNQLRMVEEPDGDVFTYTWAPVTTGGEERQVKRDDGTDETFYVWDGQNIVREIKNGSTVEADFTYEPRAHGNLISQRRDGETSVYHFDALGSTIALTQAGVRTDDERYQAFGKTAFGTGTTTNPYRWNGQQGYHQDAKTKNYNACARDYAPAQARFQSEDPMGFDAGDSNFYRYVANDPINKNDPSGLEEESVSAPYAGPIQLYEVAQYLGQVPPVGASRPQYITAGDYTLVPNYLRDSSGKYTILSHYLAAIEVTNPRPTSARLTTIRHDYIIAPGDVEAFTKRHEKYSSEAAIVYGFGARTQLLDSQIKLFAGEYGDAAKSYLYDQWTDPVNYLAAASVAAGSASRVARRPARIKSTSPRVTSPKAAVRSNVASSTGPAPKTNVNLRGETVYPEGAILKNWNGEDVKIPKNHTMSLRDPAIDTPPVIRKAGLADKRGFTDAERQGFLAGNDGGTLVTPHHRHQIAVRDGGVLDELPRFGHPEGNIHLGGGNPPRHPNDGHAGRNGTVFDGPDGAKLHRNEITRFFKDKGARLVRDPKTGLWIDPSAK